MNKDLIRNIVIGDIDFTDYPDFSDAYICFAYYGDTKMTNEQLDEINKDRDFVQKATLDFIYY